MHLHSFLVRTGIVNPPARLSVGRDDSRVQACGFSSPWPPGAAAVETYGDHVAPPQAQAQAQILVWPVCVSPNHPLFFLFLLLGLFGL